MSFANAREPVTLVRSPTLTNSESSPMLSGSRPERRMTWDMTANDSDVLTSSPREEDQQRGFRSRCGDGRYPAILCATRNEQRSGGRDGLVDLNSSRRQRLHRI